MTRINLIPAETICDQHLVAEIKEINQLAGSFRKSLNSANGIILSKISPWFTLNAGHVYFFYDKGKYLHTRFNALKEEAIRRGYVITAEFNNEWADHPSLYNDWTPDRQAYMVIGERLLEKLTAKPLWYKLYGREVPAAYFKFLSFLADRGKIAWWM